jgi:hypothetical protein
VYVSGRKHKNVHLLWKFSVSGSDSQGQLKVDCDIVRE